MRPKILLTAIAILLGIIALTSCSVQQRRYMPGYHVQWIKKTDDRSQTTNAKQKKETPPPSYTVSDSVIDQTFAQAKPEKTETTKPLRVFSKKPVPSFAPLDKATIKHFKKDFSVLIDEDGSNQRLQNIGLLLTILGVALIIISIAGAFTPILDIILVILFVLGVMMLITGLVISIIELKKAKQSNTYVKRGKAKAGKVIGLITLILLSLLLILAILAIVTYTYSLF